MKRKAGVVEEQHSENQDNQGKKKKLSDVSPSMRDRFAPNLFSPDSVKKYSSAYANSGPYKHAVVSGLVNDALLRSVRREILDNIHFTPKETDIYKIHQSGDLANLDGLDPAALEKLPSLLQLRDALYSSDFRGWISEVSGAGHVSGKKTDMAVNVYVPGCHLLCHDDVIGSRRVSYILYLTDPDLRWQPSWGGALRLYPTNERTGNDGKKYQVPREMWSKVIPPAWNQLSFFEVRPGESFHDVEEVYHRKMDVGMEEDGGRVRMAISGWFHIPQEGEEGYEAGLEERLAEQSSLQQLQGGKADQFDEPQTCWLGDADKFPEEEGGDTDENCNGEDEGCLTAKDLELLLQYMNPSLLTPDIVDELNDHFADESMIQLSSFLHPKFGDQLREYMATMDANEDHEHTRKFRCARPPHKHRYCYLQKTAESVAEPTNPVDRLLHSFLPSTAFRKWLSLVSGLSVRRTAVMARRFRRGLDYQLAQGHESEPQLEYTLNVTPSAGWGADDTEEHDGGADDGVRSHSRSQNDNVMGGDKDQNGLYEENGRNPPMGEHDGDDNVGGYELYMAGDDMDDSSTAASVAQVPASVQSHTGAGQRRPAKSTSHSDPAVYRSAEDEEDDGILFSNPASWNTFSLVLRDAGTLKFVKYVSARAQGDRWDFTGSVEVVDEEPPEIQEE
ncbi:hypothetical protein M433DRAFT_2972 [Acidomyces richmondensis BFW]|nr:MAG: hypothetical protein FE78DRAFT_142653 [Acidomyces sp. 'richmondensis']KYG47288.1 hypothetical protein M433DRAFT_2972 [Acidomyces richmondensis BFW]